MKEGRHMQGAQEAALVDALSVQWTAEAQHVWDRTALFVVGEEHLPVIICVVFFGKSTVVG